MASEASDGQRWVSVTPLVFLACSVVGFLGIVAPALVGALLPKWAHGRAWLVVIALPPALALLGSRAYARQIARTNEATRVGWLAFWAALSWPVCVLGMLLMSALVASRSPRFQEDENAAEVLVFLLFLVGGSVATLVCWLLSRTIVRALWPKPVRRGV
jgi:hypothetical protein